MGTLTAGLFAAGQVILLPFPFSDLSRDKLRPALILAPSGSENWIVAQITSNGYADPRAIRLGPDMFRLGSLPLTSYVRPSKLFTAHEALVSGHPAVLTSAALQYCREASCKAIREL